MTGVSGQKVSQTVTEAWSLWFGKAGKAVWTYPLDFTVSTSLSPLGPTPQPETVEGSGDTMFRISDIVTLICPINRWWFSRYPRDSRLGSTLVAAPPPPAISSVILVEY